MKLELGSLVELMWEERGWQDSMSFPEKAWEGEKCLDGDRRVWFGFGTSLIQRLKQELVASHHVFKSIQFKLQLQPPSLTDYSFHSSTIRSPGFRYPPQTELNMCWWKCIPHNLTGEPFLFITLSQSKRSSVPKKTTSLSSPLITSSLSVARNRLHV